MSVSSPERPEALRRAACGVRRVLIVSADMGEGHNATGQAVEEAVHELWPAAEVRWLDALAVMGRGVGPAFCGIYVTNVQHTPWLYEYFYRSLWRHRWFAAASKRFVGSWCGRRLARPVTAFAPDLVVSTYPVGTAGLEWLGRHRGLAAPVGAWIPDFAPHPFWVYGGADLNVVMHPLARPMALRCVPGAAVAASAPPVRRAFRPGDGAAARESLGLPAEALVALVCCGSLGFGDVEALTRELLASGSEVTPVVACGRNDTLRRRMERLAEAEPRVRVLGWTDRMPTLVVAADVVVGNAGGASALEALACGTPVLMYRPIAAHGRANASLMAQAGLAIVCERDGELTATVRALVREPRRLATMAGAALAYSRSAASVADVLAALAQNGPQPPPRRLNAQDALFLHVDTPEVPQQVGAVLVFDPKPDGTAVTRADAAHLLAAAPRVCARLVPPTAWRRPAWREDGTARPEDVLTVVDASRAGDPADLDAAMDAGMDGFFGTGVDPISQPCAARLVTGIEGGQAALLIKIHHAASDGIAVIGSLVGRARGRPWTTAAGRVAEPDPSRRSGRVRRELGEHLRGLWALARAGRAPRTALSGPVRMAARHHSRAELPAAEVRAVARALGAASTDVALAVLADGLHRLLGAEAPDRLRVMVPMSTRTMQTFRAEGNHTGAAAIGLPTGPMPPRERAAAVAAVMRDQVRSGAPAAAQLVVRAIGLPPPWLHRRLARLVYRHTWFSLIASVLPGARSPVRLNGALVRVVYPVLPLAPGVGLSVGLLTWADKITVCVTSTPDTAGRGDALAAAVGAAFDDFRAAAGVAVTGRARGRGAPAAGGRAPRLDAPPAEPAS